eukprot:81908-Pelagomonas_calceolata.AAC.3
MLVLLEGHAGSGMGSSYSRVAGNPQGDALLFCMLILALQTGSLCASMGAFSGSVAFKLTSWHDLVPLPPQSLVSRFGWKPMEEEGRIIGVSLDGQSVTIEPGGQFELSGAPVDTIQKTCAEVNNHLYQVPPELCITDCST